MCSWTLNGNDDDVFVSGLAAFLLVIRFRQPVNIPHHVKRRQEGHPAEKKLCHIKSPESGV
jgi:hypothetical protein